MILYVVRHAEAVELDTPGAARDFDRALTPHGRDQARALAAALVRMRCPADAVVASPLVRAHQTAVELLTAWVPVGRVTTCDALAPERYRPAKLAEFLGTVPGDRVAAVGHMPDLGDFVAWLLGAAEGTIPLAKAACACVEFRGGPARGAGELRWLAGPEWFL
jgi:phosphohistidine phosphatase